MNRNILGAVALLLILASAACTSVDQGGARGYTRPDCPQDYLTGPKFPCYNQR
jgi:hypothetical protein